MVNALVDPDRAGAVGLGLQCRPGGFFQHRQCRTFPAGQIRQGLPAIEVSGAGVDQQRGRETLFQSRAAFRAARKIQPFRLPDAGVDDRALQHCAAARQVDPAIPGQPQTVSQGLSGARDVAGVGDREVKPLTADPAQLLTFRRVDARRCAGAPDCGCYCQRGAGLRQRFQQFLAGQRLAAGRRVVIDHQDAGASRPVKMLAGSADYRFIFGLAGR